MGALEPGERRLLLVLGALAVPEGADVGGESRLLLGRVLAVVVLERGVGLGRVIVHRVAEEEKELWASVWLVSDVACQQSFQQVRQSRGALHARERAWRRVRRRRRRGGRSTAEVHGWHALMQLWVAHRSRGVCGRGARREVLVKSATQYYVQHSQIGAKLAGGG
eukprot:scaffold8364_cov72-Phaeocystis_antarctica.AAC.1